MNRKLMLGAAIVAAIAVVGCSKDQAKPYVIKTYSIVNDAVGLVKQSPAVITNNVGTVLTISKTVRAALVFIGNTVGADKVKPCIEATDAIIVALTGIDQDPSQVTAKIDTVVSKMVVVRDGLVSLAKWVGCEADLPVPKSNVARVLDDISADAQQLQQMLDQK
jgi:hypothetical protein